MTSLTTSSWQLSKLKNSRWFRSWTVWARIAKFYRHIHANMLYICTWYYFTNDFQLEVIAKKLSKMPPQTASGGISWEWFKRGSPNFTQLSRITGATNLPDMTSLVASGRLQNTIKYWTKVMRKTGPVGKRVKQFDHCLTQIYQMLHGHPLMPT